MAVAKGVGRESRGGKSNLTLEATGIEVIDEEHIADHGHQGVQVHRGGLLGGRCLATGKTATKCFLWKVIFTRMDL